MYRCLVPSLLVLALSGCAATLSPDSLKKPAQPAAITFENGFTYDISEDFDLPRPERGAVRGLLPGTYVAEFEDERGIYYRGAGTCVIWNSSPVKRDKRHLTEGGVWIEKGKADPAFRLYRYSMLGTDRDLPFAPAAGDAELCRTKPSATPVPGLTRAAGDPAQVAATAAMPANSAIVPTAIGTALGGALVGAMIESERGKIVEVPLPPKGVSIVGAFKAAPPASAP